jgi:hypothetical protein
MVIIKHFCRLHVLPRGFVGIRFSVSWPTGAGLTCCRYAGN